MREVILVQLKDDDKMARIMGRIERLRRLSQQDEIMPTAILVKELNEHGDAPKIDDMNNTGFIRALADEEKLNAAKSEIAISKHARNRLVHMTMRQLIRVRSLIVNGMGEDDAIDVVRGRKKRP